MKWIPAVAIIVGFINCDQQEQVAPPPQPSTQQAQAEQAGDSGAAKKAPDVAPAPVEDALFLRPYLYEVTKPANHRTSWLFGTVNAKFDVEFNNSPQSVKTGLMQTTHAMFEVPTGSAAHRDRTKLMAMNDGSLRREVGAARFKKLIEITKHQSAVLDVMKPWVVYLALEEKLAGDPPMDEAFESFAQSYRKRMVYLESVQEQVALLDRMLVFDDISKLIDAFPTHEEAATKAAEAYRKGDDDALRAAILPPDDGRTALHLKLMAERVPRWATKLGAQFDGDATFAVVEVRYLIGPNNLVDALRANGWKVERVSQ